MPPHRIYAMKFSGVYPHLVHKAERKGRSKDEVDEVIRWLTGYDQTGLDRALAAGASVKEFFAGAPRMHPKRKSITGVVCGVRVEEVEDR